MSFRVLRNILVIALLAAVVAGCSSTGRKRGGGYYQDDGPDANPPSNLDSVPDAVPRIEPFASGSNKPYVVFGKRYVPDTSDRPFTQHGIASWYGKKFHGNATSTGESYNMYAMTAAHPTLPIPSYARVTSAVNGRSIIVRVNDRGPFHSDRIMDLSYVAAYKLGIIGPGSGEVTVTRILPDEIRRMAAAGNTSGTAGAAAAAGAGAAAESALMPAPSTTPPAPALGAAGVEPVPIPAAPPSSLTEGGIVMRTLPDQTAAAPAPQRTMPSTPQQYPAPQPLPPTAPARSEPMQGGSVYLQLGAFSQPANANALAARVNGALNDAGLPAATVERSNNLYRVRVGPYTDRNAAVNAAQPVAERTGIQPSVVVN
jgi:rare lipoprotein A